VALCPATAVRANILVGHHDWDPGPHGWTNEHAAQDWTTLERPATGGNTGGWLRITFPETSEPEIFEDEWYETIYTPAENLFAGSWSTQMWVEFDFWASNAVPEALQVQWQSSTNDYVWGYVLTPTTTQTWTTFTAPLHNWDDWNSYEAGGSEDQFLSDLSTIDWIGVYIWRSDSSPEVYGLDDFRLMIPEPAESLMLAAALVASAMSFRKRRTKPDSGEQSPRSNETVES